MGDIAAIICQARTGDAELQGLTGCFGSDPSKQPPSSSKIAALRAEVPQQHGFSAAEREEHHECSTWRFNLVRKVQERWPTHSQMVA